MSDLKMSDVFGSDLVVRHISGGEYVDAVSGSDGFFVIEDSRHWCCSNKNHAEYAIAAINAYDSSQWQIAELKGRIKLQDAEIEKVVYAGQATDDLNAKQQEQLTMVENALVFMMQRPFDEDDYISMVQQCSEILERLAATTKG